MNAITPLARAVLDVLDTCERGAGDTEIFGELLLGGVETRCFDRDELVHTLVQMLDCGLIEARFADWPTDASVSADPIIYEITEAGCAARWALLKAERPHEYAHPVAFNSRSALTDFLRSSRL
jgi:hypothetical protein